MTLRYSPPSMTGQVLPGTALQPTLQQQMGVAKPDGYNPYAAGPKQYGATGRTNPTSGPVSPAGLQGYQDRGQRASIARQASLNMLKAQQTGNFASPMWLGGQASGR